MKCLRRIGRWGRVAVFALIGWLAVYGVALAQAKLPEKKAESSANPYVIPYILVLLGIGLGMFVVCRPSNRRERAKTDQYEESKTLL